MCTGIAFKMFWVFSSSDRRVRRGEKKQPYKTLSKKIPLEASLSLQSRWMGLGGILMYSTIKLPLFLDAFTSLQSVFSFWANGYFNDLKTPLCQTEMIQSV